MKTCSGCLGPQQYMRPTDDAQWLTPRPSPVGSGNLDHSLC